MKIIIYRNNKKYFLPAINIYKEYIEKKKLTYAVIIIWNETRRATDVMEYNLYTDI